MFGLGLWMKLGYGAAYGAAASALSYILNALGIASSGIATITQPSAQWIPDYTGTLVDMGGAVGTDSNASGGIEGARLTAGVVYDTAIDGTTPLQPFTLRSDFVKDYTYYPRWTADTLVAEGDRVHGLCDDGILRWFECTVGGTTSNAGELIFVSDDSPVSDGPVTWVGDATNYHTLRGSVSEPSATNLNAVAYDYTRWAIFNDVVLSDNQGIVAPNGLVQASEIDFTGATSADAAIYKLVTGTAGDYTHSVMMRHVSGGNTLRLGQTYNSTVNVYKEITVTSEWALYEFPYSIPGTMNHISMRPNATNTSGVFEVWGSQFETGLVATSRILTTTATVTRPATQHTRLSADMGLTGQDNIKLSVIPKELGREQWLMYDPTSGAGVYLSATNKVNYTDGTDTLTSTTSVTTAFQEIEVQQTATGATLLLNGVEEDTDATMTTAVPWGETIRIADKGASTNVLNGNIFEVERL